MKKICSVSTGVMLSKTTHNIIKSLKLKVEPRAFERGGMMNGEQDDYVCWPDFATHVWLKRGGGGFTAMRGHDLYSGVKLGSSRSAVCG